MQCRHCNEFKRSDHLARHISTKHPGEVDAELELTWHEGELTWHEGELTWPEGNELRIWKGWNYELYKRQIRRSLYETLNCFGQNLNLSINDLDLDTFLDLDLSSLSSSEYYSVSSCWLWVKACTLSESDFLETLELWRLCFLNELDFWVEAWRLWVLP